jgi:hypothetical protein
MMTTPTQELCELLRTENACHVGFYEHCTKAADLIEAQAARIAELQLEGNHLTARMNQARITIGALEEGYANDLNGDLELLREHIKDLVADRDSWRDQCSQRVMDWSTEHERVKALEAKCALLAASLDQEEWRIAALEAQIRERGEPVAYLSTDPREWDRSRIKPHGNFTVPVYAKPPAAAASEEPKPSLGSPLTPYGMLVRALRIAAGTTLMDMSKHLGRSPAELSSIEFGRKPIRDADIVDAAHFFACAGIYSTTHALTMAARAAEKAAS